MAYSQGKKKDNLTEMITEEAQTLELFIKDVKINCLKYVQ